jgi:predicted nucleotidyltransferase
MAANVEAVNKLVSQYVSDVRKTMPIDKVFLYGSYAKGTQRDDSDVDLCFFSSAFTAPKLFDAGLQLLGLARKYNREVCIEPQAFPTSELDNDNPFVKEILRTGQELL